MSAEAGVVRILVAFSCLGNLHDHAHVTLSAVERGLQVVRVLSVAFTVALPLQDALDFREGLGVHEDVVVARAVCVLLDD